MREYAVKITDKALTDINGIYEYIALNLQSLENAMGQYNKIADAALELGFFPEKFRLVDFEPERSQGLRRMLANNYSIFYVFKDETITVTRVLYSASDIEKRLKEDTSIEIIAVDATEIETERPKKNKSNITQEKRKSIQ